MKRKNVIITGANSGIGKAIATILAREGANVIMVCRNEPKGRDALNEVKEVVGTSQIELMVADLSSIESMKSLSDKIHDQYETIDVLINNAGVMLTKREESVDGFEKQFAVNYIAPLVLSHLMKDLLIKSKDARIITVSSGAHKAGKIYLEDLQLKSGYSGFKAYGQSKLAVTILTALQAEAYDDIGITVNCFHPGVVATNISVDRESGARARLMKMLSIFFISPDDGAQTAIYLAKNKSARRINGAYFYKMKVAKPSKHVGDQQLKTALLIKTLELLEPYGIREL